MTINISQILQRIADHQEIYYEEMLELMRLIMQGKISSTLVAAITMGLRVKKETVIEVTAAAEVMREFCTKVEIKNIQNKENLIDIVGTGGDNSNTFNISSCASFVIAAAGAKVSKHGNRGVSGKSGSADLMESIGININLSPEKIAQSIEEIGIGFMFAPNHHPAMKNVAEIRKELGIRTIFNILGPLTNPASAPNILMGVFHEDLVRIQIRVLQNLGLKRALVVYGRDGIDEISLGDKTLVAELKNGQITEYEINPEDFGFKLIDKSVFKVNSIKESKDICLAVLNNVKIPALDLVILNAGIALYVADVVSNISEGLIKAKETIQSGKALKKLEEFKKFTKEVII